MDTQIRLVIYTLFLLTLSGCETMQAVDRGIYSAVEGVTERDKVTGQRSLSLQNRSEQIKKGNEYVEKRIVEAKASGKKLNGDYNKAAYQRIQNIFSRLHQISHVRDEQWTPILIQENNWNAYTTGGTYFVINSGLEEDLKEDSELANVIAHEMAHTVANHVFEGQSYMQLSALKGSKSAKRDTFQAAFTHENEAEADRIAVLYCALAGYDPYAGARIWQRMLKTTGNDALFVHDHPMNSERAQQAERIASLAEKYYIPNKINPDFATILNRNEVFAYRASSEAEAGKGGGLLSVLDATLTTMNQRQQARLEEQRQLSRIQFMQSVHRVSSIISSEPAGPSRWRVTVKYGGNRPLTDLSFKLFVKRTEGNPLVITQSVNGVLKPNTAFYVDFESSEFNANNTNPRDVQFIYDNARAL